MGKPPLAFGWETNFNADGFEQEHGRFTMEVYYSDISGTWRFSLWEDDANGEHNVIETGTGKNLADAKNRVLSLASQYEKAALAKERR